MCGICGTFTLNEVAGQVEITQAIQYMTTLMSRRGPDDEGTWSDGQHCTLGFRRLAILDLSPSGNQPMLTANGRHALVFNGEVYNFRELRHELETTGIRFRSTGDAEVVLYALAKWGTDALDLFNGMFALGFYDTVEKSLLLARDHAGVKPLYYVKTHQGLVFASQYDQILVHPWSQNLGISQEALGIYLRFGYIPAPYAILQNTHMLEAGSWLEINASGNVRRARFFEFPKYQTADLFGEEAVEALDAAITNAVRRHLVSDVPVGTFLSGGIDSPLVAAKIKEVSQDPIKAFTIGTNGDRFDESPDAIAYADEIGLQHIVEHVSYEQALAMLDDVVAACGEPFADYSIFPTMLVSQLARREVKVMLSGDGGDELFWGYSGRFSSVIQGTNDFQQPYWLRGTRWAMKKFFDIGNGYRSLMFDTIGDWYRAIHTHTPEFWLMRIFPELPAFPPAFDRFSYEGENVDHTAQWVRWNEFLTHLTMVLLKVDRASMYHSLEVRVPLLDREVVKIACRIDWRSCLDIENGIGKLPLRVILGRYTNYQTSAKRGFSVPMDAWLRGPLRGVFEEAFLSRKQLLGMELDRQAASEMFQQHLSGQADHAWGLWLLLSLALWQDKYYRVRDLRNLHNR